MHMPAARADQEQPGLDPSTHGDETGEEGLEGQQPDLEAQQNELDQQRAAFEQERGEFENERNEFDQHRAGQLADLGLQRTTLNQQTEVVRAQSRDLQRAINPPLFLLACLSRACHISVS